MKATTLYRSFDNSLCEPFILFQISLRDLSESGRQHPPVREVVAWRIYLVKIKAEGKQRAEKNFCPV